MTQTTTLSETLAEAHRMDGRLSPVASRVSASHVHMPGAASNTTNILDAGQMEMRGQIACSIACCDASAVFIKSY